MKISRDFKCCSGCSWFADLCDHCSYEVTVESPVGNVIGYVKQRGSLWKAHYDILNDHHQTVLEVKGPAFIFDVPCWPSDQVFELYTPGKVHRVGDLTKLNSKSFIDHAFGADRFEVNCK